MEHAHLLLWLRVQRDRGLASWAVVDQFHGMNILCLTAIRKEQQTGLRQGMFAFNEFTSNVLRHLAPQFNGNLGRQRRRVSSSSAAEARFRFGFWLIRWDPLRIFERTRYHDKRYGRSRLPVVDLQGELAGG